MRSPIYTNRRYFAGEGWVIELHSWRGSADARKPERRFEMEVAVLSHMEGGKLGSLVEYGNPSEIQRLEEEYDGRPASAMSSKL